MTTTKRQTGSEIVKALEGVWREIMKRHPELPDVVIITGSGLDGMGARWAHFWRERWMDKEDRSTRPELFIAGERLACGGKLTVQSMLHEAAHALAFVRGIQDTSRQGRYHNKEFVKCANELGLDYTHEGPDKVHGFSAVTLTEEGEARYGRVIEKLDTAIKTYLPVMGFEGYSLTGGDGLNGGDGAHRISGVKRRRTTGPSRNNIKYVCQCETPRIMRMSRRAFEEAPITCGACGREFEEASE
jgi:hypothetical protein